MKNYVLESAPQNTAGCVRLKNENGTAVCVTLTKDSVTAQVYTDFREEPLTLQAPREAGKTISLTVRPHRLELRVDGALWDEEWPVGENRMEGAAFTEQDFPMEIREIPAEDPGDGYSPCPPRGQMRTEEICLPGVHIGDCMPYSDGTAASGGLYHLFYLYDRHHHHSKWGYGAHQWAHIATADFEHWTEYPMAVPITEPWEGSICTGSVGYSGGRYYGWYAVRMTDGSPARLTCAVSEDLIHFRKSGKWFTLPAGYEPTSARDPKIVEVDGKFHLFVTTSRTASGHGCLAHLMAEGADMQDFVDCGPILEWESGDQPECPDYFRMGEYYYLVYSIRSVAHYVYAKEPFTGFMAPENNTIPCACVPKSALLDGRRIFAGMTSAEGYGGNLVLREAVQNPDGTLEWIPLLG